MEFMIVDIEEEYFEIEIDYECQFEEIEAWQVQVSCLFEKV